MMNLLYYPGAKNSIAKAILKLMPTHDGYTEAFGGSAAVMFAKQPSRIDVYNDLNEDIVNVFRVLRTNPDELSRAIALTPFSRVEYKQAYEHSTCAVERARRTIIRSVMGFGAKGVLFHSVGFRAGGYDKRQMRWVDALNALPEVVQSWAMRFKDVVIECDDAMTVLRKYDSKNTLHYIDPPYVRTTRRDRNKLYKYEMNDVQHSELIDCIHSLKGMVILSGYDSDIYNSQLRGFIRYELSSMTQANTRAKEVLWVSPKVQYQTLFSEVM
ncbi:MAG: DNA adenine methylase [Candidatus Kapabacteria bacterium]|nr:DNA adenine methylase [Candidatus Kapabacteria bacterium]